MKSLISVDEALALIASQVASAEEERVPLAEASDRRLSRDVLAGVSAPPTDVSAMDGYAVRFSDVTASGSRLKVVGEIPAGQLPPGPISSGEAMRIFTGAPLPAGADHVLIQEEAMRDGDVVRATAAQTAPRHVREAGRDFSVGDVLVASGQLAGPVEIGLAAAGNNAALFVRTRLKVAIITAGNELQGPGRPLGPSQIVDSISPALVALVHAWGGAAIPGQIARDSVESIMSAMASVSDADIVVPVGGASVGDYDLMKAAFQRAGAEILFSGVAVRPGKPVWFARRGDQRVLGLPGNPASAYVCAHLFLKPLLNGARETPAFFGARLTSPLGAEGGRDAYLRAVCSAGPVGLTVDVLPDQDSSLLRPLQKANCLVRRLSGSPPAAAGDVVRCLPLAGRSILGAGVTN